MTSESIDFLDFAYKRMIETLKTDPLYQQALTVPQILEIKPPSEDWLKDNEVRQLVSGKYVPLNEALEINRKAVDTQVYERNEAQRRYDKLKRAVDLWKQFISIEITGNSKKLRGMNRNE
jgi:hypothetical protein